VLSKLLGGAAVLNAGGDVGGSASRG
jgi:hypothetical protein